MHLTLRQLRVFECVARHLNRSRAAAELHLTQPAVSMQIKQIEETIGLPLFEQAGKQSQLTDAGRELYQASVAVAGRMADLEVAIDQIKGVQRGRLRISVASTANYFAPRLFALFSQRHPGVSVTLDVTNREQLLNQLTANATDLVIMGRPPENLSLMAEAFMDNPLVVIAPCKHSLARRKAIPLSDLRDQPFLMREEGSGTRGAIERHFAARSIALRPGMEMRSNEAIKQAVQAGLGLGILSMHTLEQELALKRIAILDVEGFPIMRHWYIVHRADKRLSPVAQAFKQLVLDESEHLLADIKSWIHKP